MHTNPGTFGRRTPVVYDLYTGGDRKSEDLAIYYNVAHDNVIKEKEQIKNWPVNRQQAHLAEFLWMAHKKKKNADGYQLTANDFQVIPLLIEKLEQIRNYQSHIWHSNEVLAFEPVLKNFVMEKYQQACAEVYTQMPDAYLDYESLLHKAANKKFELFFKPPGSDLYFITNEGRVFLLSFFLTSGQMFQCLQQRKGSKRADLPLFKVKREIYTYYCHRDGAAITDFNHTEQVLAALDTQEKQEILHARTAFKLVNYLFDYPHYWADPSCMPLLLPDGSSVKDIYQLRIYLEQHASILPGLQFVLIPRKAVFTEEMDMRQREELVKETEDAHRAGAIAFTCAEIPGFLFHIPFNTLYRLVLLQLLYNEEEGVMPAVEQMKQNLLKEAANRRRWYSILAKKQSERTTEELEYLFDKKNQYLRGTNRLTEQGIIFIETLEQGNEEKDIQRNLLRAMLRPADEHDLVPGIQPEPIMVYQQDFVAGTTRKFRTGNLFMLYASRYLVDFCGDNWYWGVEKFEMKKKDENAAAESLVKVKQYLHASALKKEQDCRLTIENDHVYVAVLQADATGPCHQRFTRFSIGPLAMRYLIAAAMQDKNNFANRMKNFLQKLQAELNTLRAAGHWQDEDAYELLEKQFIAGYLLPADATVKDLLAKVQTRKDYIIQQWDKALAGKQLLSRAEKNRLIMQAYRLFDWPAGNNGHPRFLRAAEYNEMSICHYSLHLKSKQKGSGNRRGYNRKGKFDFLFEDLFKLSTRKPPIPVAIQGMLKKAGNLDELLELVINDRKKELQQKYRDIAGLSTQLQKKELPALARLLGISIAPALLKETERAALQEKQLHTLQVQIFPVHPMMMVKHFFPDQYQPEDYDIKTNKNGVAVRSRQAIPVFINIRRNANLRNRLYTRFYQLPEDSLLLQSAGKKQREKLAGIMNTACTEDILLWQIANRYLQHNEFTGNLAVYLDRTPARSLSLDALLKMDVNILLNPGAQPMIHTSILLHQLDDLIYKTEKNRLLLAAKHFLHRCTTERSYWQVQLEQLQTGQLNGASLPDGTKQHPIPFRLLLDEIELVRRTGKKFAGYILDLERRLYNGLLEKKGNKETLQHFLKEQFLSASNALQQVPHLNFYSVLNIARDNGMIIPGDESTLLTTYRNNALHNLIPETGSFSWVTKTGEPLRQLLGITENLDTQKDRSGYIRNDEEHKEED